MNLTLKIWRQKNASEKGKIVEYKATNISPDMSFLEMMDVVNTDIIKRGESPLLLITIVEKEFVVVVPCILTGRLMALAERLQLVNFTCVNLRMVKLYI